MACLGAIPIFNVFLIFIRSASRELHLRNISDLDNLSASRTAAGSSRRSKATSSCRLFQCGQMLNCSRGQTRSRQRGLQTLARIQVAQSRSSNLQPDGSAELSVLDVVCFHAIPGA